MITGTIDGIEKITGNLTPAEKLGWMQIDLVDSADNVLTSSDADLITQEHTYADKITGSLT